LVKNSEGKTPPARPRSRCEDNIGTDLSELGWKGVEWKRLVQVRDLKRDKVNRVMENWVPKKGCEFHE
jgi:hypothetical protein